MDIDNRQGRAVPARHRIASHSSRGGAAPRRPLAVALLLSALLAPAATHAEIVNRILATVDGDPITLYELRQFAEKDVRGRQVAAATDAATLLDALITERIIDKEFAALGLSVRDADVERYIDGTKERTKLTDQQLRDALTQQGLTWEQYQVQVRKELQKAQLIRQQIQDKVNVTPEEVERYYQAHLDEYSIPGQMTISHVMLRLPADAPPDQFDAVMARARRIHAELRSGASFEEAARRYSEDASAESGGKLGMFKEGEMQEVLEATALKLKPGEFSEPLRSSAGIHILRLDERSGASHQPLESLAQDIRERLYNEALEERFDRWLREDLRERHHVELRP